MRMISFQVIHFFLFFMVQLGFRNDFYVLKGQSKSNNKKNKKKAKSVFEKEISILTGKRHMYSAYYQVKMSFLLSS